MTDQPSAESSRKAVLALLVTACCLEALYWFIVTAGRVTHLPRYYSSLLNDLAEGFRLRHLHMAVEPPAALLAQANPFDPAYRGLWYWDVSLYGGHYYLYWGPVPAMFLAVVKTLLRSHTVINDEVVVFWLASLQLVAGIWIIRRAARSFFAEPPVALQVLAALVMGLANPTPYNLARGCVYEAAIVGGQAFLLLGVACAAESVARGQNRARWRAAAGVAWALALGCRVSLAPAVALMAIATALVESGRDGRLAMRLRRVVVAGLPLGMPLLAGIFGLLLYNRFRFDAWLEFGRRYQLTWISAPTSSSFILPSLYSFLLRKPALSCRFPFFFAIPDMGARAFPAWFHLPPGYFVYEQVAGTLLTCPWSWLAPIAVVMAVRQLRSGQGAPGAVWAVVVAGVGATVALLPAMTVASATNRYLGDAVGGIVLSGVCGAFYLHASTRNRGRWRRRAAMGALGALGAASAFAGLALGFLGQYAHFPNNNPPLGEKLVQKLSVCGAVIAPQPN
ncbi:MAG TPA: hypothetical protein VHM31_16145 [Polyangia bacterium]|nr:hypothetical protein [Polyangia bacterium]